MKIIGIDLAWKPEKNSTAIAVGTLSNHIIHIEELITSVIGMDNISHIIEAQNDVAGISIDAPLIIRNQHGQRECEAELNTRYRKFKAGCHPSNLTLYPQAGSVTLADRLLKNGFIHAGNPAHEKWQIECYPHPAMVELFQLSERLPYKKGTVIEKKQGQCRLAELLKSLGSNHKPGLILAPEVYELLKTQHIMSKRGQAVKQNEDALDAILCTYIGACYASKQKQTLFGNTKDGYIYVPQSAST